MYTANVYLFVSTDTFLPASNTDLRHLQLIAFALLIYIKKEFQAAIYVNIFFVADLPARQSPMKELQCIIDYSYLECKVRIVSCHKILFMFFDKFD